MATIAWGQSKWRHWSCNRLVRIPGLPTGLSSLALAVWDRSGLQVSMPSSHKGCHTRGFQGCYLISHLHISAQAVSFGRMPLPQKKLHIRWCLSHIKSPEKFAFHSHLLTLYLYPITLCLHWYLSAKRNPRLSFFLKLQCPAHAKTYSWGIDTLRHRVPPFMVSLLSWHIRSILDNNLMS